MRKKIIISFLLLFSSLPFYGCATTDKSQSLYPSSSDVIIFDGGKHGAKNDVRTYTEIAHELGYSCKIVDYNFINNKDSFFGKNKTKRKFGVLIFPGGEPYFWFELAVGRGINCDGVKNILEFVKSGGSVIGICLCGPSLFAKSVKWQNPNYLEAQFGSWDTTHSDPGWFSGFCGVYAFKGSIIGPQESNRPYPTAKYLPIKMNLENELVREANLPSVIYQLVVGGGSIIPDEGQPLDVIGWYPNGTAAIGIVPYGDGRIIMSNPHPNVTGNRAEIWRHHLMTIYSKSWGWNDKLIAKGEEIIKTNKDLDGSKPDWELAKAMLSYAYKKASQ
jgi:glutamine amidotransferase-like uncharacterized protein